MCRSSATLLLAFAAPLAAAPLDFQRDVRPILSNHCYHCHGPDEQGRKGGLLVASSQGDNAYALYRLPDMKPAGRFRIGAGALGSVEETDGIALAPGNFGRAFPQGLLVAQDGDNAPAAQNFKLVSWKRVKAAVE